MAMKKDTVTWCLMQVAQKVSELNQSVREVKALLIDYIAECRQRNILELRIIHGKGTGALRRTVHAALDKRPEVASFRLADETGGSWGATLVTLKPAPDIAPET